MPTRVSNSVAMRVRLCGPLCHSAVMHVRLYMLTRVRSSVGTCVRQSQRERAAPCSCVCDYVAARVQLSQSCVGYYADESV